MLWIINISECVTVFRSYMEVMGRFFLGGILCYNVTLRFPIVFFISGRGQCCMKEIFFLLQAYLYCAAARDLISPW